MFEVLIYLSRNRFKNPYCDSCWFSATNWDSSCIKESSACSWPDDFRVFFLEFALSFSSRCFSLAYCCIWFFSRSSRISKSSWSRYIFLLTKLSDTILVYLLIGLDLLSIFYKVTCINMAWNLASILIFFMCFWNLALAFFDLSNYDVQELAC